MSSSTRNCHNFPILFWCTLDCHLLLRFVCSVCLCVCITDMNSFNVAEHRLHSLLTTLRKGVSPHSIHSFFVRLQKENPSYIHLLMASWPLLPRSGSEVLNHQMYPRIHSRESSPSNSRVHSRESSPTSLRVHSRESSPSSSSQSLQHQSELFAHVGILFRGQGHRYFFPRDVNLLS